MDTQTQKTQYPATTKVYIDYGLRGRMLGPYRDIMQHFHEVDQLTDARELISDLQKPFQFPSLQKVIRSLLYWLVMIGIVSVAFLFYLVVLTEEIEDGLEYTDVYYLVVVIMFALSLITYFYMTYRFQREMIKYVNDVGKGYSERGVELTATTKLLNWRGGIEIKLTRFKEGPMGTGTQTPEQRSFTAA